MAADLAMSGPRRAMHVDRRRSLALLASFDLASSGAVLIFYCVTLEVVSFAVMLGLIAIQKVALIAWLGRLTAPLRAWSSQAEPDEPTLRAAARTLSGLYRDFALPYTLAWVVVVTIALGLAALGVPRPVPVGAFEYTLALLGAIAMALGIGSVLLPLSSSLMAQSRQLIGQALLERRRGVQRAKHSIVRRLDAFHFAQVVSVALALVAFIASERVKGIRAEAEAMALGEVTRVATELRAGFVEPDQLADEFSILDAEALAPILGPGTTDAPLTRTDRSRAIVVAAHPLDEGQWLVREVPEALTLGRSFGPSLLFALLLVAMDTLAATLLNRTVSRPLIELDELVRRTAEVGDLGAIERVATQRSDELGALISNFNHLLDTLETLANAAASVAGGDLRVEFDNRGELPDAFRAMVAHLHAMVEQLRATALELTRASGDILDAMHDQERGAERQLTRMTIFGTTAAALAGSAEDIHHAADEVLANAEQTMATTGLVTEKIAELEAQTRTVGELLAAIREFADRSDLLALNGSLEATRAGEAGRGFSIVAAEMRRLAERVTGTVDTVHERVVGIEAASADSVEATARSRELATRTAAAAERIATITSEQSRATEQVSREVQEVTLSTSATASSIRQTQAAVEALSHKSAELDQLTARFELRDA